MGLRGSLADFGLGTDYPPMMLLTMCLELVLLSDPIVVGVLTVNLGDCKAFALVYRALASMSSSGCHKEFFLLAWTIAKIPGALPR